MTRWARSLGVAIALSVTGTAAWIVLKKESKPVTRPQVPGRAEQIRKALFEELIPVTLANCNLERFGESHDGGYLVCGNLLTSVQAGYSYGISGYDGWGCDISRRLHVRVHQYDCFDSRQPACPGGDTLFHSECVAGARDVDSSGRLFDTVQNQLRKNGDDRKSLVVKIDVEGAEWDAFLKMPDEVFERIAQLIVEFHGVHEERFVVALWKLKQFFHVAHRHFNNRSCLDHADPFPAWAYEVLLVNKQLGVIAPSQPTEGLHPLDARNDPDAPDCQAVSATR